MEQGLESHPVIFEVDKHHRDQQQELGKCKADCIFHPQQGAGERPPHLMQKDSCVSELAQKMEVTESAISHQLRALRIVRLVQSRKAGKNVIYSLQDEHIRWILEETYAHISER